MQGDKWVPNKSHALGSGNLRKWLSIVWSNYGHEYLPSSIECALVLNALLRATRLAYFPYVTYPVHFRAVTIAR
jgi:hypothetical protein